LRGPEAGHHLAATTKGAAMATQAKTKNNKQYEALRERA
jgi:hypothetical protein